MRVGVAAGAARRGKITSEEVEFLSEEKHNRAGEVLQTLEAVSDTQGTERKR